MSLKSSITLATGIVLVGIMTLLPTMASAGGYRRYSRRHHQRHHYRHGDGIHLGINLGVIVLGGLAALQALRGHQRVGTAPPHSGETRTWRHDERQSIVQQPYCREFQRDIIIDGKPERAYGTACLQPDGSWKIVP